MVDAFVKNSVIFKLNGYIEIYRPKISGCQDSFFYDGDIAKLKFKNREVFIVAVGDIRIDKNNKMVYKNGAEHNEGIGFPVETDKDLEKISKDDNFAWENNNWFELAYKLDGDEWTESFDGDTYAEYDEAIEGAKTLICDDDFWEYIEKTLFKKS
jgi:hypothetical protein